ncbi:TonB-dependent receptor plug domain-containing protein [Pelagicoccus mobilis]|uniref:TonB-dependent receptor plug domain-containing protein n=1 Tax=Pelagicoccus mobilis TaxID=415221 RepID=A0A934RQX8_9BACT|nr:TonB-dependent receptor plug domain-containing protein [Pelagicoccus mobilis]MBK1875905.1 TonB-dependent receptor plug domain-containing protein [Pelagicoccus mobilis]
MDIQIPKLPRYRSTLGWAALIVAGPLAFQAAYGQEDQEEEIFELSPFTVEATEDEGYRATSSLAGSRLRTDLKDIGAAISVVTKDLMDDLGANDLNDVLLYTTATEAAGLGGNFSGASVSTGSRANSNNVVNNPGNAYRIRGLGAPDRTRGYFITDIPYDSYNSGRIDISRGANSILFGLGSPAGVIDAGVHQANTNRDRGEVRLRIASGSSRSHSYRAEVDYNKVLIDEKLGFRFSGVQDDRKFRQDPAFRDSSRAYMAFTYKPWEGATFKVNHERGKIDANNPDPVSPTENVTSYVNALKEYHSLVDQFGVVTDADGNPDYTKIPADWDVNNLPFYYDSFARAAKLDKAHEIDGVAQSPLYRLPNQVISGDAGYANPFHTRGSSLFRNLTLVYDDNMSADAAGGFISQVRNKEATDYATYLLNGGVNPDTLTFNGKPIKGKSGTADMKGVQNVGYTNLNYHYPTVMNLELFDFTRHLLAGTAGSQIKEFDATTATFEQTFWENNFGFEVSFYDETYEMYNANPFRAGKAAITVDVQKTLPIGGENPNFGRTYVVDRMSINNQTKDRNSIRATAFARVDFEEKFLSDNFLGRILGEHTLTGLYARDELDSIQYNINENWISQDPDVQAVLEKTVGVKSFQRQVAYLTYLGPAVDLLSDPKSIEVEDFALTPNAILNQRIPDTGGIETIQMYNQGILESYDLERAPYIRGGTLSNVVVDSGAIVLQSRWLDDTIITTYGYREDERSELKNTPPPLDPNDPNNVSALQGTGNATIDPLYWNLDDITPEVQDADTSSFSVVARLPKGWNDRIFGNNDVALFYSTSDNTSAGPARLDWRYDPIAQPSGETEEIGVNASLFEGKLNLRVNKFESSIVGANGRGRLGSAIGDAALKSIQTVMDDYVDLAGEWDAVQEEEGQKIPLGERLYPNYENIPAHVDAIANLFGASINLPMPVDGVISNPSLTLDESHPMADVWIASQAQLITDSNGDLNGVGWFHRTPPNLADTQDIVSEGLEAEIIFNPTKSLRMMLNVARTETKTANSLPYTKELIDLWEPVLWGDRTAGTPSGAPYIYNADTELWEVNNDIDYAGLSLVGRTQREAYKAADMDQGWGHVFETWDKAVVNPYNTTKALDGQKNPEEREWRVNFITNYTFREGRFKGFSFGGSVRWQDEVAIGYPLMTILGSTIPDVENPYYGPDEVNFGLRAGYKTKLSNGINWNISLNLNNITSDQDELIPVGVQPDGSVAVVRTPAPQTFSLTNSFQF